MNLNAILVDLPKAKFDPAAYRPSTEAVRKSHESRENVKRLARYKVLKAMREEREAEMRERVELAHAIVHPTWAS